jgi:hypothetical protein
MFMRLREFTKVRGECDMKIRSENQAEQGLTLRMYVTLEDCGAGDLRGWVEPPLFTRSLTAGNIPGEPAHEGSADKPNNPGGNWDVVLAALVFGAVPDNCKKNDEELV